MRQIVLDTETTGLRVEDGHRIIEFAVIELINRRLTGKECHYYINPEREVEAGALAVHGISNEFLKDKPVFFNVVDQLMDFISGAELIIHNAPFDVSFLNHELSLTKQGWKPLSDYCSIVDTLQIARQLHVGQRNSLDALCKRYGVDNSKRELHGALLDTHLLAHVYLAMTGGQGSFFDGLAETDNITANKKRDAVAILQQHNLLVINANDEEMAIHQRYLEGMKKKGKCVWEG